MVLLFTNSKKNLRFSIDSDDSWCIIKAQSTGKTLSRGKEMALFDDFKRACEKVIACKNDEMIGNPTHILVPVEVMEVFEREYKINFVEPEEDDEWRDFQAC